ncbi:transposase [Bartonella alsatica]|uniref:transposase n=1 Tax=Bartonella alsatica TaxID=52764 RepID=UPI001FD85343|nr:transposase [Bartonella alsatica]
MAHYEQQIIVVDCWYARSKIYHHCRWKVEQFPLNIRQWKCFHYSTPHDRNINAAINLKNLTVNCTVSVCREENP